jgi:glycerophosphoryl diester phosphodiesterase
MRKKMVGSILGLGAISLGGYAYLKKRSTPVPDHPFLETGTLLVMAHRGGRGLWPPNTLCAFQQSEKLGVDVLEMDIHLTRDGEIVVRHDPTVEDTTNGTGAIAEMTLAEIKELDAGYTWSVDNGETYPFRDRGITIPTLEEILVALPGMRLNIDIKPEHPAIVPLFARMLTDHKRLDQVLVASFHDDQLNRFRALCPAVATAAGMRETLGLLLLSSLHLEAIYQPRAVAFQLPEYQGKLHVVTERFIRAAHRHNMQVHPWTVNEVQEMRRLLDWGVDGLITDYPDRLMKLLGRI